MTLCAKAGSAGRAGGAGITLGLLLALFSISAGAQGRSSQPQQTSRTGGENLTASSANVSQPGNPVQITIVRWSTEEERRLFVAALNPPPPPAAVPAASSGSSGPPSPAAAGGDTAARGGRAGAGRGGRGRGRGSATAPLSPIAALTAAIGKAPTIGYVWTNGITGYSIKYAYHAPLPDGGERIILATDRRLGAYLPAWTPVTATSSGSEASATAAATDYEFTLIEMRMNSKGSGEGKTSLTAKVIVDGDAKTLALDDYAGAALNLKNVNLNR
jgi:hypothetical protein